MISKVFLMITKLTVQLDILINASAEQKILPKPAPASEPTDPKAFRS
jgi:hypothetical protein